MTLHYPLSTLHSPLGKAIRTIMNLVLDYMVREMYGTRFRFFAASFSPFSSNVFTIEAGEYILHFLHLDPSISSTWTITVVEGCVVEDVDDVDVRMD